MEIRIVWETYSIGYNQVEYRDKLKEKNSNTTEKENV